MPMWRFHSIEQVERQVAPMIERMCALCVACSEYNVVSLLSTSTPNPHQTKTQTHTLTCITTANELAVPLPHCHAQCACAYQYINRGSKRETINEQWTYIVHTIRMLYWVRRQFTWICNVMPTYLHITTRWFIQFAEIAIAFRSVFVQRIRELIQHK